MITRQLAAADRKAVEALCASTAEMDLVLLASLDQLSGDGNLVQYWGQFDSEGRLQAVLMRYHVLWYLHADTGEQVGAFARVIREQGQPHIVLNGRPEAVAVLSGLLTAFQTTLDLLACLRTSRATRSGGIAAGVRQATLDDVESLSRFYESAPADVRRGADSLRRSVAGGRRTLVAEEGGQITAAALTTAELPTLAMVGGLHTVGERPLAAVVQGLLASLQAEGKSACVVTRDPFIDGVLDQLGFITIGDWRIQHLNRP